MRAIVLLLGSVVVGQELPKVPVGDFQPVMAQAARIRAALRHIGAPLPPATVTRLRALADAKPSAATVAEVQAILDPFCVAMVDINPESRVKVLPGPATPELHESGWKCFLVKVRNQAGTRAALTPVSPNAAPFLHRSTGKALPKPEHALSPGEVDARFLEVALYAQRPMQPRLSGLGLEYAILQVYCCVRGKREVKLGFHVGAGTEDLAFRNAVDILFECIPAVQVVLRVQDEAGAPTIASFTVTDGVERIVEDPTANPLGADYRHSMALAAPWDRPRPVPFGRLRGVYPLPARRLARVGYPDFFFQPQVYRGDGEHILLPPGVYDIRVTRGPEYRAQSRRVVIPTGVERVEVPFRLERWVHLKALGYYSVDHHVHAAGCSHYESPEQGVEPEDMWRQVQGEDLNVACVLTWGPCWYHQKTFFTGGQPERQAGSYQMRYDVEVSGFPSSHAGHVCLLRLKEDDYPGTTKIEEWPSYTLPILRWAKSQGGVTGYAHSGFGLAPVRQTARLPNYAPARFDGIGANEFIVAVTEGLCDFISAGDTPWPWELNIWYHTLNVGYRTVISGETDFPCIFDERVGMARSYAQVDGPLTFDKAITSIQAGRSYVSEGRAHIIDFTVGGQRLGVGGSELALVKPQKVRVVARVAARLPVTQDKLGAYIARRSPTQKPYWDLERARVKKSRRVPVQLVVNGEAVAQREVVADGNWADVTFDVAMPRSGWIALRVPYAAHTNPIFVLVDGAPVRASRRSAAWCRAAVGICWNSKSPRIRDRERAAAKAAYDRAKARYEALVEACFDDR